MKKWIMPVVLFVITVPLWYPLWMLLSGSLMGKAEVVSSLGPVFLGKSGYATLPIVPAAPTLRPYVRLLLDSPEFFVMFWNSMGYVAAILVGQVVVAVPAAWGFARYKFRGGKVLYLFYVALMLMPFQVTLVAQYISLDALGLMNTRGALIWPAVFSTFPVFIMVKFFEGISEEVMEASALDGAGELRTFMQMGLPLGLPGILSALVLGFFEYWNMIEQPMTLVKDMALWPLSLFLPQITSNSLSVALTASVLILIPALLIFLCGQPFLEQGISVAGSGVKE